MYSSFGKQFSGVRSFYRRPRRAVVKNFIFTIATSGPSETFTIPCLNVGIFDAVVNWGDGSKSSVTSYNDSNLSHNYATEGNYTISISGSFPSIYFRGNSTNAAKVRTVESLGDVGWESLHSAFSGCDRMTSFSAGVTNTSGVTDMERMFFGCADVTSLDVSSFDTSSVTTMYLMFYNCRNLMSLDLSNFDTSSVENTGYMFNSCAGLTSLDLSNFDTSSVTTMRGMFYFCRNLMSLDLSNFDTSSVIYMHELFYGCSDLTSLDVSSFDTSGVIMIGDMFNNCSGLTSLDVSNFDTSSAVDMGDMFYNCRNLMSLDLSNFDTSRVKDMNDMFYRCAGLTDVIGVENFNIEALDRTSRLSRFMGDVTLPTARYDALLVNWDAQEPFDGMTPDFGNSRYTAGSAAATARANLISNDGWTITDGGTA